jgi:acyl carrier protein
MTESAEPADRTASDEGGDDRQRAALLALVGEFLRDLNPHRAATMCIEPTSRLERDLGIDSLARSELALRIERDFRVRVPLRAVTEAETVTDLAAALREARLGTYTSD